MAIVELGGLSAASRKLGRPKSTLSRDLARLEEEAGARLIERTTRRLRLTEAGEVLLSYARRVGEELDNAEAAMQSLRETPRGHLVVSAPFSFVQHVLAPRIAAFRAAYPELTLSILPGVQVVDFVADGVDVAVRIGDVGPATLIARKLADAPLVMVASPEYIARRGMPDRPEDLPDHALIDLRSRAQNEWTLFGPGGAQTQVAVAPEVATPEPAVALGFAQSGIGVATAPYLYAASALEAGALVRVLPDYHRGIRQISVVHPSRRLSPPKVRAFVDFIIAATGDGAAFAPVDPEA